MHVKTAISAAILGLSGAALAQVAAPTEPKLGNGTTANATAPGNASNGADPSTNSADAGKS